MLKKNGTSVSAVQSEQCSAIPCQKETSHVISACTEPRHVARSERARDPRGEGRVLQLLVRVHGHTPSLRLHEVQGAEEPHAQLGLQARRRRERGSVHRDVVGTCRHQHGGLLRYPLYQGRSSAGECQPPSMQLKGRVHRAAAGGRLRSNDKYRQVLPVPRERAVADVCGSRRLPYPHLNRGLGRNPAVRKPLLTAVLTYQDLVNAVIYCV